MKKNSLFRLLVLSSDASSIGINHLCAKKAATIKRLLGYILNFEYARIFHAIYPNRMFGSVGCNVIDNRLWKFSLPLINIYHCII
jgi:hypothetical protein